MGAHDPAPSSLPSGRYTGRDDAALIKCCLAGDSAAWGALIDRYQALIYATLRRAGLSPPDADDTFQDVSLLLYSHLARIIHVVLKWPTLRLTNRAQFPVHE